MSQEDVVTFIRQLNDDPALSGAVQQAQSDAIVAEAKKTGLTVTREDIKSAVAGAQKSVIDITIPGWLSASASWD